MTAVASWREAMDDRNFLGGEDDAVALIEAASGAKVTYRELAERVEKAAARLQKDAEGDVAFVFASNDVATVVELLAGFAAGVAVALFDPRMPDEVMDELRRRYRPGTIRGRRTPPEPASLPARPERRREAPKSKGRADLSTATVRVHPELGLLLTTSGSTGSPKLVRLTRRAVAANARAIAEALAIRPGEVAPTSLPIHYSYGLSVLTSHLAAGATVMLTNDGLLTDAFWTACREHRVTSLAGVPYSYLMLRRIDLDKVAPPTLRTFTQAGGRLDPALVRHYADKARARGGRLYVMYGQTEATARMTVLPPDELPARAGSVGRPIPGGTITIDDGEVVYRGANVMMGYATERADLGRADELEGELRTGDLGYLDADGFLWITGRSRRIAKVFGLRLNLDELEELARAEAPALELAALGDGDRVVLFTVGADDAGRAALRTALAARLGIHPTGILVTALSSMPRLSSGKIDYRGLEVPT